MQNTGIIRLFLIFIICFSVLFYNAGKFIKSENEIQNSTTFLKKDTIEETEKTEEKIQAETKPETASQPEKAEENTSQNNTSAESKTVSATAVKGKIINKYISPYNAGVSYNKVYIKNSTDLEINVKNLLESQLNFKLKQTEEPQVLIMHTHTTETYMTEDTGYYTEDFASRSTDNSKNMAKIGDIVAEKLNSAGIKTIHDTTQHDYPNYTGSYSRAAKTICSYIDKYPSIKIVLDLHRDAVSSGESDKVKLTTEINGKKAAQVMLVMGSQSGTVTNFPNWKENLKLAVKLQQTMEEKYPTLARPLMLMPKNYNESLTTGSLLLEFGTDANTLEEASYSATLVGDALVTLLKTIKE